MRQRRWLELLKDYDVNISYHLGKSNTVADALSRKADCNLAFLMTSQNDILKDMEKLCLEVLKGSRCPRGGVNWAFLKINCKN
jgi:hypothetical protein